MMNRLLFVGALLAGLCACSSDSKITEPTTAETLAIAPAETEPATVATDPPTTTTVATTTTTTPVPRTTTTAPPTTVAPISCGTGTHLDGSTCVVDVAPTMAEANTTIPPTPTVPASTLPTPSGDDVALCNDGNFSNNTEFDKTCSGGDGVDHWLAAYGKCNDGYVITMGKNASCDGHNGFAKLLPAEYTPTVSDLTTILNDRVDKAIDNGSDVKVVVFGSAVVVTFKATTEGFTTGSIKDALRFDVIGAAGAIKAAGYPDGVDSVVFHVNADLTDKFGNAVNVQVLDATYSTSTLDQIQFGNENIAFLKDNFFLLADQITVDPAFAKSDGS